MEILWGVTNLNFKLNLKVSAFYLEKKSFIPKKKNFYAVVKIKTKKHCLPTQFSGKVLLLWRCANKQTDNLLLNRIKKCSLCMSPRFFAPFVIVIVRTRKTRKLMFFQFVDHFCCLESSKNVQTWKFTWELGVFSHHFPGR